VVRLAVLDDQRRGGPWAAPPARAQAAFMSGWLAAAIAEPVLFTQFGP
jgi:hypothetical protein